MTHQPQQVYTYTSINHYLYLPTIKKIGSFPSLSFSDHPAVEMLDFNFHLTTPRLYISYLNPSNDAHCDFMITLVKSPEITEESKSDSVPVPDREAGRKIIQDMMERMEQSGYGRYLVSLKPDNDNTEAAATKKQEENPLPFSQRQTEPVGVVTMMLGRHPGAPTIPDVGFGLLRAHQGQGYATEAAEGLVKYFEDERGQREFSGFCNPENQASANVFRRLGFEERGVREVRGIVGGDKMMVLRPLVWTKGVGGGEEELKQARIG